MTESELISIDKNISLTCGCQRPVGFIRTAQGQNDDWREIEGYSLNCHQWDCPACAKVLTNQLRDRINYGLQGKSDFYFYTLTSSYHDMQIKSAFNRFRTILYDNYPIDKYVQVMELTPPSHPYTDWRNVTKISVGGLRHFHGLMSFVDKIPCKAEFGAFWERATKGKAWHTHFEKLWDIKSPAGYMSKYLSKGLSSGYRDRERRVMFSQNFPKLPLNLEPKSGVYLSYDPRHEPVQRDDFAKMLEEANLPFKNKGKRFL
jgi:hypothetical protein